VNTVKLSLSLNTKNAGHIYKYIHMRTRCLDMDGRLRAQSIFTLMGRLSLSQPCYRWLLVLRSRQWSQLPVKQSNKPLLTNWNVGRWFYVIIMNTERLGR